MIEKKYTELSKHFSKEYLDDLENTLDDIFEDGEIPSLNLLKDVKDYELINNGGVLAALWKICDRNKWGLKYSLSKIPILQGTIEISNYFDLNPYRLLTSGSRIIAIDESFDNKKTNVPITDNKVYIPFTEIGETTTLKKRVRIDGEAEAFLTKDFKDEIDRIIPRYCKETLINKLSI